MKNKFIFFSFLLLVFALTVSFTISAQEAPPLFDWQSALGGASYDAASKIIRTSDDGYLLVGTTYSSNGDVTVNHGSGDVWIVKIDGTGTKQWQQTFGGTNIDAGTAVVEFPDGKIFIAGNTNSSDGNVSFNHGSSDIWIIALQANGDFIWQKTYGGSSDDMATALLRTTDDHLLIGGSSQSSDGDLTGSQGSDDFWLLKIDTLGAIAWQKTFGGSASDICNALTELSDGSYIAVGSSGSVDGNVTGNHGKNDYWVIKTDNGGNLLWQKTFGGSENESALSVIKNTAGNIVIAGYTNSNDNDVHDNRGGSDYWMTIVDTAGTLLKEAVYGGSNSEVAYSIVLADDGGYLIAGGSYSDDFDISAYHGAEDFWLMKTDSSGNPKWSRTFGGSMTDRCYAAVQTADGGFIMAGYTYSNNQQVSGNHGSADMWVAKLSCKTPVASYLFEDDTLCVNSLISLTNSSINSAVYSWLINGIPFSSNTDATFQFGFTGTDTISLLASTCYASNQSSHGFTVLDYPSVPTITLSGFLFESTPASSYQWFSNGQPIAGATSQDYSAVSDGYYYVMVGNAGKCFSFSDSLYFQVTAINSIENNEAAGIFPNPAHDQFTVYSLQFNAGNKLEIYNALGKKIYSGALNSKQETIDCTLFPDGIYLVNIESGTGNVFRKLIVSH